MKTCMKKTLFTLLLVFTAFTAAFAGKQKNAEGEIVKSGWNFGPLPVIGFDSDLGLQGGLCCDIYNYGDGSSYPQYLFKINVEASNYTKGSSILRSYGDFKNIIENGKLFYDITYFSAPKYQFFGFNGYASPYDKDKIVGTPEPDASSAFNFMNRSQFRTVISIQKKITGNLNWAAGLAYYHISTGDLNTDRFDSFAGQKTLYSIYRESGLIRENEADGGNVTQVRAGLVYDSRDHDSDPSRGVNVEAALIGSPDIIDDEGYSNLRFSFMGSQYIPLVGDKLTLAYRLAAQLNICGETPYYMINNLNNMFFRKLYTEGLGGNASVRGINRNGVIGDGTAMLNVELRWRAVNFKFINQNWCLGFNPFFDAGQIIQPYRKDEQKLLGDEYFTDCSETPHCTGGLGVKLIMNHNMVISFEMAKALNSNDGSGLWSNIGFNYLF